MAGHYMRVVIDMTTFDSIPPKELEQRILVALAHRGIPRGVATVKAFTQADLDAISREENHAETQVENLVTAALKKSGVMK